ncbi:phage tail assembly chaperone (plasmid) [Vibrio parahaemolyticus]|nr:phage tail assembly chaperone [Vibrio parahaemolyticus]
MRFHEPDYGIPTNDQKMAFVRYQRDELIADTDWTQVPDAQLSESKRIEFAEYRQALRDIPQTYSNPDDVAWPVKPTI